MGMPAIEFLGVGKRYSPALHHAGGLKSFLLNPRRALGEMRAGSREVLHDVTFSVERGESFAILGRNGAGKSTLLGLIAGVLRPTVGMLQVRGRVSPLLELGAGFHPELSGRDNILLNGVLLGMRRAEVLEKLPAIIAYSELEEMIDEPARIYSSGMLARLGFSVAVHLEPEILLIDEVLAVGDGAFREKCMATIRGFHQRGVTVVFVSHDLAQVSALCERALVLGEHSVQFAGPVAEAIALYRSAGSHS